MNRVWGLLKWVREKVNVRLALVALVLGTGLLTGYLCYSRFLRKAPLPEPKKITTGGAAAIGSSDLTGNVQPAANEAPLYDPGASPQPGASPAFAFNSNANSNPFGQPPATQPPPLPPGDPPAAPPFGDSTNNEPQPNLGQTVPYQPVVAGGPNQPPAEPPLTADPMGPLAYGTPGDPPPNPIRTNGATIGDDPTQELPSAPATEVPEATTNETPPPAYAAEPPSRLAPLNPPPGAGGFGPQAYPEPAPLVTPKPLNPLGAATNNVAGIGGPASVDLPREPVGGATGQSTPGQRQFEGAQTPALALEKLAPAEIQVGKVATFELRVKNVGQVAAQQVQVIDYVPRGTQLVEAKPQFQRGTDGSLIWPLGTMQPGDEQVVQLQVMPQTEGEIGSVAQVTFAAQATSRSVCTRPLLTIEHTAPEKLLIGESLSMVITVTNPGTGAATGVVVEEDVPQGLLHVAGAELEYEIGTLRPGESKRLELTLRADKAGIIKNTIVVRGDGNLTAQHAINIEVVAPQLQVGIVGPKKRFLERPATYTVSVSNPGTASARDVELVAYLPRGMKFVETDAHGTYDSQQHAVFWSLEELPASKAGNVKLTAVPLETGDQKLRIEGRADLGLTTAYEQVVSVDAAAELIHTIADLSDPIEVGSETTYEVKVVNVGTKSATNIRIAALLPAELKALSGEGPTRAANDGSRVIFEPLARLNPQEEAVFRIQAQAQKAGDFILRVQISSTEWPNPVTREESTRVYLDR
jgi:uncharacterized repeat protein (TIGR01451 family)